MDVGILNLYYLGVFFPLSLYLFLQAFDLALKVAHLQLVRILALVGFRCRFFLLLQVFEFLSQLAGSFVKLIRVFLQQIVLFLHIG